MKKDASHAPIHQQVRDYYTDKLRQFGPTPRGVDWRDLESQERRFAQLMQICGNARSGSLIELGCGYGALYVYLRRHGCDFDYSGYDLAEDMVQAARATLGDDPRAKVSVDGRPDEVGDYCVASGIFNVRLAFSDTEWRAYMLKTLDHMAQAARKGFAFNVLTRFSDPARMDPRLYYADPGDLLTHCLSTYGRRVGLLHGYGLYEFTVLVWKAEVTDPPP
jgi:SAM-dependent methyltransferase